MKRNLTVTLQPRIEEIIGKMYENGLINSKSQLVELALLEWLQNHKILNIAEEIKK